MLSGLRSGMSAVAERLVGAAAALRAGSTVTHVATGPSLADPEWAERLAALVGAVRHRSHHLIIVSDEVGLARVPDNRAGRIFVDWLGLTNPRVAAVCDVVQLVVAGHVVPVKQP